MKEVIKITSKAKDQYKVITERDDAGCTLLHCAAMQGNLDIVWYLIAVMKKIAIKKNNPKLVQNYINIEDKGGETVIKWAQKFQHQKISTFLQDKLKKPLSGGPLHSACIAKNINNVRKIIAGTCSAPEMLTEQDECGDTPLHLAVTKNSPVIVGQLLTSMIQIATKLKNPKLVTNYLKMKNKNGQTVAQLAAKFKYKHILIIITKKMNALKKISCENLSKS